jgi:hypothetical protein
MSETEPNTPTTERVLSSNSQLSADDILSLFTQLLGELAERGCASRSASMNGSTIIQIHGVMRHVGDDGLVRFVTAPMVATEAPQPTAVPATTAG